MRKLFALPLLCASAAFAQTTVSVPSLPLQAFQQSLGVNTHLNYTDGEYANVENVLADLSYLGITNIRDSLPNPGYDASNADADRQQVAAAGIHFDFLTTCDQTVAVEKAGWDEYASKYPGSILSVEGTNEINNAPCPAYGGQAAGSQASAVAFQRGVYAAVHADPLLKGTPVLDFTGGENETTTLAGQADVINTHPYPSVAQQPYAVLTSGFSSIYGPNYTSHSYPTQITETGYQNFNYQGNLTGMDGLSVAEMTGNAIFDSALQGNTHIYLYQLMQAYGNVQTNGDTAYGLFDYFNQPTDFAIFLHNLHTMLPTDVASAAKGNISVVLSGNLPTTAHLLALTTSATYEPCPSCVIVFGWNEQPEFNSSTDENEPVTPLNGYIQLKGYTAVGQVFPGYPAMQSVQQAGTENGSPYYDATLFGFPVGIAFKPAATSASSGTQASAAAQSLLHSMHGVTPISRVQASAHQVVTASREPGVSAKALLPAPRVLLRRAGGVE